MLAYKCTRATGLERRNEPAIWTTRRSLSRFLHDLNASARADSGCTGSDHGFQRLQIANAARGLDAQLSADDAAHERDVGGRGAAGAESSRRLYVIRASGFCQRAGSHLLVVGQQRRFDDDLAQDAAVTARRDDGLDVPLDQTEIAGLQRSDVDDGVNLSRSVEDGAASL